MVQKPRGVIRAVMYHKRGACAKEGEEGMGHGVCDVGIGNGECGVFAIVDWVLSSECDEVFDGGEESHK